MIDIENKIIDTLSTAFSGVASVSSTFVDSPSSFPWVYAHEISNAGYAKSYDNALIEHDAVVSFRVEYYSSRQQGGKQEVKDLAQIGDITMQQMKFRRTAFKIVPNWDRAITRAVADYRAVVHEGVEVGGNTVHQIFR